MRTVLKLDSVTQAYGKHVAVKGVSFDIHEGEIACLLGPSGSGKTSILRAIAGFENLCSGTIIRGDELISSATETVAPEKRRVGMVFQDYALFPHLTVEKNIAFGISHLPKKQRTARVAEMLALVELSGCEKRYPYELSGGQQQRVALARALAPRPSLLLLDEPFSNLDVSLREQLCVEVKRILKNSGTTALMVTHHQAEAFAMADVIGVMHEGVLQQWGTPEKLYHSPANSFVATFLGAGAIVQGTAEQKGIVTPLGIIPANDLAEGDAVEVLVRPEDVHLHLASGVDTTVVESIFRGAETALTLRLVDGSLISTVTRTGGHPVKKGDTVRVQFSRGTDAIFFRKQV